MIRCCSALPLYALARDNRATCTTLQHNSTTAQHSNRLFPPPLKMPLSKGDALLNQALKGKVDLVLKSISLGIDVNFQDEKGVSPLHKAAHYNRLNVVNVLMDNGANADIACHKKWTALMLASTKGYVPIVQILLQNKADVNCLDLRKSSALHYAAEWGHAAVVKLLLKHGARLDTQDEDGMTPFHYACKEGYLDVVNILCDSGSNVDQANNSLETPMHLTIKKKSKEIVEELIRRGADIELKDEDLETPLHCACAVGDAAIVTILCNAGVEVDPVNEIKETPLHLACQCHRHDAAESLLYFGANIESRDANNCTPLHVACEHGKPTCIQLLLDKGANPNAVDAQKRVPRSLNKKISAMLEQKRNEIRRSTIDTAVSIVNSVNRSSDVKEEIGWVNFNNPRIGPSDSKVIDLDFYDDDDNDDGGGGNEKTNSDDPDRKESNPEATNDQLSTDSEQSYEKLELDHEALPSDSSCDDPGDRHTPKQLLPDIDSTNIPCPDLGQINPPSPTLRDHSSPSRQSTADHSESNTTVSSVPTNALVVSTKQRVDATTHNTIVPRGRKRSLPTYDTCNGESSRRNTIVGRMRKMAWTLEVRIHPAQSMLEQVTVMERMVHGEPQRGKLFDRIALLESELGFDDNA